MDISASAFHSHLRGAEAELFEWLFDDGSDQ
jgi:predicted DNA binding protein